MSEMLQNDAVVNALGLELTPELVGAENQPSAGTTTGEQALATWQGLEVGVWEMSEGIMHDTEVDEISVVLTGEATVEFLEPQKPAVQIGAGSVLRFAAGTKTKWTVTAGPLRKVYLVPA